MKKILLILGIGLFCSIPGTNLSSHFDNNITNKTQIKESTDWDDHLWQNPAYEFWVPEKNECFFLSDDVQKIFSVDLKTGLITLYNQFHSTITWSTMDSYASNISENGNYLAVSYLDSQQNQLCIAFINLTDFSETNFVIASLEVNDFRQVSSLVIDNSGNIYYSLYNNFSPLQIDSTVCFLNTKTGTTSTLMDSGNKMEIGLGLINENNLYALNNDNLFYISIDAETGQSNYSWLISFPTSVISINIDIKTKNWIIITNDSSYYYGSYDTIINDFSLFLDTDTYQLNNIAGGNNSDFSYMYSKNDTEYYVAFFDCSNDMPVSYLLDSGPRSFSYYFIKLDSGYELYTFHNQDNSVYLRASEVK